jgi:hypothetical protein
MPGLFVEMGACLKLANLHLLSSWDYSCEPSCPATVDGIKCCGARIWQNRLTTYVTLSFLPEPRRWIPLFIKPWGVGSGRLVTLPSSSTASWFKTPKGHQQSSEESKTSSEEPLWTIHCGDSDTEVMLLNKYQSLQDRKEKPSVQTWPSTESSPPVGRRPWLSESPLWNQVWWCMPVVPAT